MRVAARISILVLTASGIFAQTVQPEGITFEGRVDWVVFNTVGPASLVGGLFSSALATWADRPPEYGTNWDGFGKRYGLRLTGVGASNVMEAGLGSVWGEDPRYHRAEDHAFGARVRNIVKWTFLARNDYGETVPAYARYAGFIGGNFLSNEWRPDSQRTTGNTMDRVAFAFIGRMASNTMIEFWPDIREHVFLLGR
jgi:hypothetical protein